MSIHEQMLSEPAGQTDRVIGKDFAKCLIFIGLCHDHLWFLIKFSYSIADNNPDGFKEQQLFDENQEWTMSKAIRKLVQAALLMVVLSATGCTDGVRQTMTPYIFDGLANIASGLIAGLEQQVFPEGTGSTSGSSKS
jgi:hypothetical protein